MEQTSSKNKLNIAIVQAYDNNIREYAEYSRLLNAMYAHEKGYTYIAFEYDLTPSHVSVYYNKIIAVSTVLKDPQNFDWVLYLDSDAAVCNFEYNIEDIIARHADKEIIIVQDPDMETSSIGVFIIKNTPKMLECLKKTYDDRSFYHTQTPEQTAMLTYLLEDPEYMDLVGGEPSAVLSAYLRIYSDLNAKSQQETWTDESFIVHFFCLSTSDRANLFRRLLATNKIICIAQPPEIPKLKSQFLNIKI